MSKELGLVPAEAVNKSVWVENAIHSVDSNRDYKQAALAALVNKVYEQAPDMEPIKAVEILKEAERKYDALTTKGYYSAESSYDVHMGILEVAAQLPIPDKFFSGVMIEATKQAMLAMDEYYGAQRDEQGQVLATYNLFDSYRYARDYQKGEWEELYNLSQSNNRAAQAIDRYFGPQLNASVSDSAETIFDKNPPLANKDGIKTIKEMIGPDGSIQTKLDDLTSLTQAQYLGLRDVIAKDRELLKEIDGKQDILIAYALAEEEKEKYKAKAEMQRAEHQLKIEAAGSAISLISNLANFAFPGSRVGKDISTVGNATLQVAQSISKYTETVSQLGELGATLGSVMLTGNVVGAALSIFSMLSGGGGPSPEEMILQEIKALQKQVENLRIEMHGRFDRIDRSLNTIYTTMMERFDKIDYTQDIIMENIEQIQENLYELQKALYRLEASLYVWIDTGFKQNFVEAVDNGLSYKKVHNREMDFPTFEKYEGTFYSWAASHSRDDLRSGKSGRNLGDDSLFVELTTLPLDVNINYLSDVVTSKFGLEPLSSARLANPRVWSASAEAYIRLAAENPQHFTEGYGSRIENIISVGEVVGSAIKKITATKSESGVFANHKLFERLIELYKSKVENLGPAFEDIQKSILWSISSTADEYRSPFVNKLDLWGGPDQPTEYEPPIGDIRVCADDVKDSASVVALQLLPPDYMPFIPTPYLIADMLNVGKIEICWKNVRWITTRSNRDEGQTNVAPGTYEPVVKEVEWGVVAVTVEASFAGKPIFSRTIKSATEVQFSYSFSGGDQVKPQFDWVDSMTYLQDNWNVGEMIRQRFSVHSEETGTAEVVETSREEVLESSKAEVSQMVRDFFTQHQINYYQTIYDSLSSANDTSEIAEELSGAKMLLSSFIALGLSRALDENDLLRSLLYGEQRILDAELLQGVVGDVATKLSQQTSSQVGDKMDSALLINLMDERISALQNSLTQILNKIDQGEHIESYRLVETTLKKLRVFKQSSVSGGG